MKALRAPSTVVNALLALLIVGATIWGVNLIRSTSSGNKAKATDVRTVTVSQGTVTKTVSADGTVASASTAAAAFTTSGTVTSIKVKVGDKVTKGQQLAQVDAAAAKRSLTLAKANLDAANDALGRAENAGTDTTTAQNEVTSAKLAVDDAEAAVAGATLTAPMAGTVTAVNGSLGGPSSSSGGTAAAASTGASATASGGFIDLADLSKLQITAAFSESDTTTLRTGQSATITWNALENAETTGKVVSVDPTATTSNNVVTYGVTISLPNPPDGAKPGQTVSVSVVTGSVDNAVRVNSAAVTVIGRRSTVTVLTGSGQQEVRQVQIGLEGDDADQITSGLTAGEKAVVPTRSTSSGNSGSTFRNSGGFGTGGGGFSGGGAPPGGR